MFKKELVSGYCPKQGKESVISVTYILASSTKMDFVEPATYYCKYSNTVAFCTDCPIFNNLL